MSLNNQSNRLADSGRPVEGLAPIEEAVTHYRTLAQADPPPFPPAPATSLHNHTTLPAPPPHVVEQPVQPPGRFWASGRGAGPHRGGRDPLPDAGPGRPHPLPARPRHVLAQPHHAPCPPSPCR